MPIYIFYVIPHKTLPDISENPTGFPLVSLWASYIKYFQNQVYHLFEQFLSLFLYISFSFQIQTFRKQAISKAAAEPLMASPSPLVPLVEPP